MKELQGHAERLQRVNDQLRALVEKSLYFGKDVQDGGRAAHSITRNKGEEPIILDNVNTLEDDALSSGSSPSSSLSPPKNARESAKAKLRKRPSHHPAFSDVVSGASCKAMRETSRGQNQPVQGLGNASVLPKGMMPQVLLACKKCRLNILPLVQGQHSTCCL